jgi:hypothetical protein
MKTDQISRNTNRSLNKAGRDIYSSGGDMFVNSPQVTDSEGKDSKIKLGEAIKVIVFSIGRFIIKNIVWDIIIITIVLGLVLGPWFVQTVIKPSFPQFFPITDTSNSSSTP